MKLYYRLAVSLLATLLVACATTDTPTPKKYTVPANTLAINADIAGKPFNIQGGVNGWNSYVIQPFLMLNSNGTGYASASIQFSKQEIAPSGQRVDAIFSIKLPNIDIPDTTNRATYYNYQTLLAHFKKGQQPLRGKNVPNGYMVRLSYIDQENMQNSFGYNSIDGDQEGSKWEIVEVKELGNNSILVRYEVDCKLYGYSPDTPTKVKLAGKLVGTIQTIVYYRPL